MTAMRLRALVLGLVVGAATLMAKNAEGVVVDFGGAPVAGATVLLKGETDSSVRSAVTKEDGTFVFVGLNADMDYSIRARDGDRESRPTQISRFNEKSKRIELRLPAADKK